MPIYSYFCQQCGTFDKMRSMSRHQEPANCPQCGSSCARQVTAVELNLMQGSKRTAHRLNEKNAHEPRVHTSGDTQHHHGHVHGPGCGHNHVAHAAHSGPQRVPAASRPWQVGH